MTENHSTKVDKAKVMTFAEGLLKEGSPERELASAFLNHIQELTDEYLRNVSQFMRQNQDIVCALQLSLVVGVDSIVTGDDLLSVAILGVKPDRTAMKILKQIASVNNDLSGEVDK